MITKFTNNYIFPKHAYFIQDQDICNIDAMLFRPVAKDLTKNKKNCKMISNIQSCNYLKHKQVKPKEAKNITTIYLYITQPYHQTLDKPMA